MKLEKQHLDGVIREWNPGSEALVPYWPYNAGGVLYWPPDRQPSSVLIMTLAGQLCQYSVVSVVSSQ